MAAQSSPSHSLPRTKWLQVHQAHAGRQWSTAHMLKQRCLLLTLDSLVHQIITRSPHKTWYLQTHCLPTQQQQWQAMHSHQQNGVWVGASPQAGAQHLHPATLSISLALWRRLSGSLNPPAAGPLLWGTLRSSMASPHRRHTQIHTAPSQVAAQPQGWGTALG